jgi:peptidylprolyl isomerase
MAMNRLRLFPLATAVLALVVPSAVWGQEAKPAAPKPDPANTVVITTKDGDIVIRLRPDLAPKHVERIKLLAGEGFYDGIVFHRVIEGFMAQTGDPTGIGTGGSKYPDLLAEFTESAKFERGTVGMARAPDPNSANSQFFICFGPASALNGQYTIIGEVTQGMDVADKIKKGDLAANGKVSDPDKIVKMKVQTP